MSWMMDEEGRRGPDYAQERTDHTRRAGVSATASVLAIYITYRITYLPVVNK